MSLVAVKVKSGKEFGIYVLVENGRSELLGFLSDLARSHKSEWSRLQRYFDRTKDYGLIRNSEQFKNIGNGLYEFRTWGGLRVFCFLDACRMVICTNGYIKKKDKLDPGELKRAEIWKQKYEIAKSENKLTFEEASV